MHVEFLGSPAWAEFLEANLLPWALSVSDLTGDVVEVGPGPGLTTDILRRYADHVTAVELDGDLAAQLADRLAGTNVTVVHGDATKSGLDGDRFATATCFSMLHHVPDAALQDAVFSELHRVLRPGGVLVAVDSVDSDAIRSFHEDDIFVPLDPATLAGRLDNAGFVDVGIDVSDFEVRFHARKG
jgi:SAM-dependent methyltransferase